MYSDTDPNDWPLATLRLFADDLLPEDIERIMALKADHAAARGKGLLRRGDGSRVPARTGTWFITTENKKIGDKPEAHLSWIVQLLERHISQLRSHIPEIQADLSLLVHDRNFEISELPEKLLKSAVSIGDLEIEVPERGIDVVLTPRNVATYIR
ncbi:MAG: DUF4279 domain-containing protein [Rhodopila sp.]|jgi:hypothetical protein